MNRSVRRDTVKPSQLIRPEAKRCKDFRIKLRQLLSRYGSDGFIQRGTPTQDTHYEFRCQRLIEPAQFGAAIGMQKF